MPGRSADARYGACLGGALCLMMLMGCAEAMFRGYAGPEKPVERLAVIRLHSAATTVEPLFEELPSGGPVIVCWRGFT